MTEELVMQIEPIENIEALRIYEAKADGLLGRATIPPITVLLRDFGGMGQIIVECDGSAWSRWFGAVGSRSLRDHIATLTAESLARELLRKTPHAWTLWCARTRQVEPIAQAVITAMKGFNDVNRMMGRKCL